MGLLLNVLTILPKWIAEKFEDLECECHDYQPTTSDYVRLVVKMGIASVIVVAFALLY